jgi:hypothetical protein
VGADHPPTVLGIGLSPIIQWLLVPPLIVVIIRALHRGQSR